MIKEFIAVENSTIYDVCMNCYGTLNLLGKLMLDNNIDSVDLCPTNGQIYMYDDSFVNVQSNQNLNANYSVSDGGNRLKYATK
jgi:hypothetical protein